MDLRFDGIVSTSDIKHVRAACKGTNSFDREYSLEQVLYFVDAAVFDRDDIHDTM